MDVILGQLKSGKELSMSENVSFRVSFYKFWNSRGLNLVMFDLVISKSVSFGSEDWENSYRSLVSKLLKDKVVN